MPENNDESLLAHLSAFERIKHLEQDGREWWSARELMLLLTYSKWQDFHKVIQAAIEVYQKSGGEDADAIFMATRKDSLGVLASAVLVDFNRGLDDLVEILPL